MKQRKKFAYLNILALLTLSALLVYNYYDHGLIFTLITEDTDSFLSFFETKSVPYQYTSVLLLVIVEVIIGVIPGPLIYPLVGLLISPITGSILILIGNILGSVANFYQGRILWSGFNEEDIESKSRLVNKLEDGGAWTLFLLRFNPLTSFDFLPYIAGGSGMKFRSFFVANTLGLIPLILIGTFLGESVLTEYAWALKLLIVVTIGWMVLGYIRSKRPKGIRKAFVRLFRR